MAQDTIVRVKRGVEIPLAELKFHFTRSGGPGGQHVNKAATQVELAFDVAGSPSLSPEQKARIASKLRSYVNQEGMLRLTCQSTRSQKQNREAAIERFEALLRNALHMPKPRRPTRPTRASQERRLAAKKRRSQRKRLRSFRPDDDP